MRFALKRANGFGRECSVLFGPQDHASYRLAQKTLAGNIRWLEDGDRYGQPVRVTTAAPCLTPGPEMLGSENLGYGLMTDWMNQVDTVSLSQSLGAVPAR